jgi:hypothetical protein
VAGEALVASAKVVNDGPYPGAMHFDVSPDGRLSLSAPEVVVGHPVPLRLSGTPGHGASLVYDTATLRLELDAQRWARVPQQGGGLVTDMSW